MNEKDKNLMKIYGVTCSTEITYCYKSHRYKKLEDALNYAKVDIKKNELNSTNLRKNAYIKTEK